MYHRLFKHEFQFSLDVCWALIEMKCIVCIIRVHLLYQTLQTPVMLKMMLNYSLYLILGKFHPDYCVATVAHVYTAHCLGFKSLLQGAGIVFCIQVIQFTLKIVNPCSTGLGLLCRSLVGQCNREGENFVGDACNTIA